MRWKTSISKVKEGEVYVRGKKLLELVGKVSFTEALYLVIKGETPKKEQVHLLDAVLVSAINHGLEAPTGYVPRIAASVGNSVSSALAAGVLMVGDYHGGAVEGAMRKFYSNKPAEEIVKEVVAKKERMPGYGHKLYKSTDPRAQKILELIPESKYTKLAVEIQKELKKQTGKDLPLNIDGAMAAALCELGFDSIQGKAFFALARLPSMMANIEEELKNEKPYRRLDNEDIEYSN
ncbi:MAG: citryl-CoA lyase [Candidatus Colwellbacteria bacterium]|nr:citryl-CoA lyase [Candidatus Colwellbacteria bacterium]